MNRLLFSIMLLVMCFDSAQAQNDYNGLDNDMYDATTNTFNPNATKRDSTKSETEAPRGMYVWRIDPLFGDRIATAKDTVQHLFMNTVFTSGMHGEFNTTGNLGAPRQNRIFIDRDFSRGGFAFSNPLDFFLTPVGQLRFTNTLAPTTLLNYYSCGDQNDGEDWLKVLFAVNVNKQLGAGFKVNYMYGRGYYSEQATSLFDFTYWTSYLGDRYQAHFLFSTDHMKNAENGGIQNDLYITHPESFDNYSSSEILTNLSSNWNRNCQFHLYLTHRYNIGFSRKVPMTPQEIEARRFALASKKEAEDKEKIAAGEVDSKGNALQTLAGRPKDAKIMGNIPADSASIAANSERIKVESQAAADSILAAKQKAEEDTSWLKDEYVPVTSFIHTISYDHYDRKYIAYSSPTDYYLKRYALMGGYTDNDSIEDITKHYRLQNTFAVALLEGFNKYVKSGLKAFITSDIRHYELPDTVARSTSYTENNIRVGAQLSKTEGRIFHYNVTGQFGLVGEDLGDINIDGTADVNVPLFGDTVRVDLNGFFHHQSADFYMRHYHSRHYWWDNDLNKITHTHIGGSLEYPKTKTSLRVGIDNINDYAYLAMAYDCEQDNIPVHTQVTAEQTSKNISLITLEIGQNFRLGPLNWENKITYQKSTQQEILPVPTLNVWTNLYLDFKIAKVLSCHLGADATYFTEYEAPEYCPGLMQYAVQSNSAVRTKIGNYPFVDVYANFVLKGCRFFVMMSHMTAGSFNKQYFTTAHYPMNQSVFRIGISWNFNN